MSLEHEDTSGLCWRILSQKKNEWLLVDLSLSTTLMQTAHFVGDKRVWLHGGGVLVSLRVDRQQRQKAATTIVGLLKEVDNKGMYGIPVLAWALANLQRVWPHSQLFLTRSNEAKDP